MPPIDAIRVAKCVKCETEVGVYCGGCFGTPGENGDMGFMDITWICSPNCKVSDNPAHEPVCPNVQAQDMLYRAGRMLQKLFTAFREVSYRRKVVEIRDEDGKVYFRESHDPQDADNVYGTGLLAPRRNIMNQTDKEAIIAYNSSGTALACMHEVIKYILKCK